MKPLKQYNQCSYNGISNKLSNAISFPKAKYHERNVIKLNDPKHLQKPTGQF